MERTARGGVGMVLGIAGAHADSNPMLSQSCGNPTDASSGNPTDASCGNTTDATTNYNNYNDDNCDDNYWSQTADSEVQIFL